MSFAAEQRVSPRVAESVGSILLDVSLVGLMLLAATLCLLDAPSVPRVLVLVAAAVLGPGGALLTRLRVDNAAVALGLAACLSFSIEIAGSLIMAWAEWWHPVALAAALGGASLILLITDIAARVRPREPSE